MIANRRAATLAALVAVGFLELSSLATIVDAQPFRSQTEIVITDQMLLSQELQGAPFEDSTQTQSPLNQLDSFGDESDSPFLRQPDNRRDQQTPSLLSLDNQFAQSDISPFSEQLDSLPYMFGDSFAQGAQLLIDDGVLITAVADLAIAGGSRRVKIAENNKALPEDRVFVFYNHFHNAITANDFTVGLGDTISVERFTLGFEKTFFQQSMSVDVRLPVTNGYTFATPAFSNFAVAGSEAGNLAIQLKFLLASSYSSSLVAGMGIDLPTGADVFGRDFFGTFYMLKNEAVHLSPFIGASYIPTPRTFHQAFVQVDIASDGNSIHLVSPFIPPIGVLNEQNLLYVDYEFGTWLYRNCDPGRYRLSGLASVIELHYTSTLDDADVVVGSIPFGSNFTFTNLSNRMDVLNLTAGLHGEFANGASARIGGVVPLRSDDNRFFDAEIQASVNIEF